MVTDMTMDSAVPLHFSPSLQGPGVIDRGRYRGEGRAGGPSFLENAAGQEKH
jgi:hypothetical protein